MHIYIAKIAYKLQNNLIFLLEITEMGCMNTDSVVNYRILKHATFIEHYAALAFFGRGCITLMKASKRCT